MRCHECGARRFEEVELPEHEDVGGHTFRGWVSARRCATCGETVIDGAALERFQLAVAGRLAVTGERSGDAFAYMRKAVGMRAADLAELLDVRPETVSRWETGAQPIERRALAVLGGLVVDQLPPAERPPTLDRLRALQAPRKLPKVVKLGKSAA